MRNKRIHSFVFQSFVIAIILSLLLTITAVADEGIPLPTATSEPVIEYVDTPTDEPVIENTDTPAIEETLEPLPTQLPDVTSLDQEYSITLPEIQDQLPENTSIAVLVDGYLEPMVTQEAATALNSGDPIWCPVGSLPVPGVGGCTNSYLTLYSLIDDIDNAVIAEPNADGVIWILAGVDASALSIDIDGSNYLNWDNRQLTLQGGWTGTSAGAVLGNSVFSVPLSVSGWGQSVIINNITINNSASTGLSIDNTSGGVVINNVSSTGNNGNGADITTPGNVSLTGTNNFNNNSNTGLNLDVGGTVITEYLTAGNNGGDGISIVAGGTVSIGGANVFGNATNGISVDADGSIDAENITANTNGTGGEFLSSGAFTLTGVNTFNNNNSTGLYVDVTGNINVADVSANDNGLGGVYGSGAELYSLGVLSMTGSNVFNQNLSEGLIADALSGVSIQNIDALNNDGYSGVNLFTNGNAQLICGHVTGNQILQIDTGMSGNLTLAGVDFGGDPDNTIGIDADRLFLVSNGCFSYPDYYADGEDEGDDGGGGDDDQGDGFGEFEDLEEVKPVNLVYKDTGQTVSLDCNAYSGTMVRLLNGDGVLIPCPIVDSVKIDRLTTVDIFNLLPAESTYISNIDLFISKGGESLQLIQDASLVWFVNPDNIAAGGYQASYFDGNYWVDVTDQMPPLMTLIFMIPDSMKGKDLAVMYWSGKEWIELTGGLDLGNGRFVGNIGASGDGMSFQSTVNFIGLFVLVEK